MKKYIVIKKTHSIKTNRDYLTAYMQVGSKNVMLKLDSYILCLLLNKTPMELEQLEVGYVSKEFEIGD